MRRSTRTDDEPLRRATPPAARVTEPAPPAGAVFDAAARAGQPGRGGTPAVGSAIGGLQATAGNVAVSRLFSGRAGAGHREGEHRVHAGLATTGESAVQRSPEDEEPAPDVEVATAEPAVETGEGTPTELAAGAPPAGPSWTKVGPPSSAGYSVTGTLREVANAISARTEAGSVTATSSQDTESWTPEGGSEQVTAARVTVKQVLELPSWTDRGKATKNQQAEWDRFHVAISSHEASHVSTDKTAYAGTHTTMIGKSPADASAALDAADAKAKTANEAFDTSTDHGRNQGTGINPNIDEVTKVP